MQTLYRRHREKADEFLEEILGKSKKEEGQAKGSSVMPPPGGDDEDELEVKMDGG